MVTVYIDVLFAVNFLINILIIEGTGVIMCEETKWYRSVMGSALGALYAVLVFFPDLEIVQSLVMKLTLSAIMVVLAFGIKGRGRFLRLWGTFYLVSFIFGGSIIALMSMTSLGSRMGGIYSNGIVYFNLPWQIVLLSGAGTYFMIYIFGRIRRKRIVKEAASRQLSIYINGTRIETKAIIDTGNSLFDPITGVPVIVCEYDQIQKAVPLCDGKSLLERMSEAGIKVRLIPFSSVGREKGIMPAFLPDMVKIDEREARRCIVGVSENKLSSTDEYHALLNPAITVK